MLVTEREAIVDVVADRLNQEPSLGNIAEPGPCYIAQPIGLAIAAAEQINQDVHRQRVQRILHRFRGHFIGFPAVLHQEVRGHGQPARGGADHVAEIAETVVISVSRDGRVEPHAIPGQ